MFLAFRQLSPAGRRGGTLFFFLSVLGVALGVAVLVIVQSVMGGFGEVHRDRMIDTSGHLDISENGYPFTGAYALADDLRQMEGVERVTPYARGFVLARSGNIPEFPAVYGFPYGPDPVFAIQDYLIAGKLDDLYDDTVFISRSLAQRLGVWVGSELEIYSPSMIDQLDASRIPLPRTLTVSGIYQIDWNQDFLPGMLTTLRTLQDLYELGDAVHGIALRLSPGTDEFALASRLRADLPKRKSVMTWRERWASFLWVLDLEKTLMLFLNLFIVAVAVFAIAIAQLLTVVRKTREIGLLLVIGGSARGILSLYCFQGGLIGLLGAILGATGALTALAFRDPIISFLSGISGTRDTLVQFYYFQNLPVSINPAEIIGIALTAMGLATLASLLPALRAARLRPAESLRMEQ